MVVGNLAEVNRMESSKTALESEGIFHILSLDGGGVRGIYPAHVLAKMEDALGVPVRDCFDLIAGTSTGSIVAGAAAASVPMEKLVSLFESESAGIFKKRAFTFSPFIRSRYSRRPLEQIIREYLPDLTMGEISTPLLIPSSDITTGCVHVFKSGYLRDLGEPYLRDSGVRLRDAILASCAAPTYFDPMWVDEYLLADGGLWANNPTIISVTEAVSKFKRPLERIHVLSIGTGHSDSFYARSRAWGLVTGWGHKRLVSYVLGLQSQASTNMAKLLLGDRHLRLDPKIESWELDNTECLASMKALADRDFTHNSQAVLANLRRSK